MEIKKATRQGIKPLIGVYGESGCGKTMTALLLARGMAGPNGKIILIDSESGRGSMYADVIEGGYDVIELREPFSPARYIEAIKAVEDAKADVLVIDSASHEHEGIGGILDMATENEVRSGKAGLHNWKVPKMEHQKFMLKMLQSTLPIIVCLRAKYKTRQKKENGKTVIVKDEVTSPIQSEDFIYEMSYHFEILQNHNIVTTKSSHPDLRKCFPDDNSTPVTIENGKRLAEWCKSAGTPKAATSATKSELDAAKGALWNLLKSKCKDVVALQQWLVDERVIDPDMQLSAMSVGELKQATKMAEARLAEIENKS